MKTIITFLAFFVCLQINKAQSYVTIPDANFVAWLQTNVPSAMNGNQMDTTSLAVTTLTYINVGYVGISDLTGVEYFDSLKYLYCYQNNLTNLISLPNSIIGLICSNNPLTYISALPSSLRFLQSDNCQLNTLPALPNLLVNLSCFNNQLVQLPPLPSTLSQLDCRNNQLNFLPELPFGLNTLYCSYNNITCFPIFPNTIRKYVETPATPIPGFDISSNPFICLPNYILAMDSTLLSYPICTNGDTINNPNNCIGYKKISGFVFRDNNNDCVKTSITEIGIPTIPVKIYDVNNAFIGSASTELFKEYNFTVPAGTYHVKIDTLNKPYAMQCNNPGVDSLINLNVSQLGIDSVNFPIVCKQGIDVGVQSIVVNGFVAPGQTHQLWVNAAGMARWYYLNCVGGVAGTVSFSVNGPVTYLSPAPGALTPTVNGNMFSYNIDDFGLLYSNRFGVLFATDTTAQASDVICVSATVTPINGDYNISNNTSNYCYIVQNSHDPNYKEVYPTQVQTGFNDWLTYTIHFQNIGGSQAMNIKLTDVLDSKLNLETFEIINYSHNNSFELKENNLLINFPNINLAPSASGFVQYRVKPKASWENDTIRNKASIYFDYNAPIVTNTTKNYFVTASAVKEMWDKLAIVSIYPNPINALLSIASKNDFEKVELVSITGQVLLSEQVKAKSHLLQLQNFSEGIYFVKIYYANGLSLTKKVIKQ